jgi:hypothetical protein
MKEIPLTRGMIAMVDDEDYESLTVTSWCISSKGYAKRQTKGRTITMHRQIMKLINSPSSICVDHKDGNPLNNCKENLRICTHSENQRNRAKKHKSKMSSPYKGVSWDNTNKKWMVMVNVSGKSTNLGRYANEIEAARVYNEFALKNYGEFAKINDIPA